MPLAPVTEGEDSADATATTVVPVSVTNPENLTARGSCASSQSAAPRLERAQRPRKRARSARRCWSRAGWDCRRRSWVVNRYSAAVAFRSIQLRAMCCSECCPLAFELVVASPAIVGGRRLVGDWCGRGIGRPTRPRDVCGTAARRGDAAGIPACAVVSARLAFAAAYVGGAARDRGGSPLGE
jgi:hypothetical protein